MTYKLLSNGVLQVEQNLSIPNDSFNRHWQEFQAWLVENENNIPLPADEFTPEQTAKNEEINQAPITAREYFASKPAARAFVRLTPAEQATQISGMTATQKDTLLTYLAVTVSMLVKRELL